MLWMTTLRFSNFIYGLTAGALCGIWVQGNTSGHRPSRKYYLFRPPRALTPALCRTVLCCAVLCVPLHQPILPSPHNSPSTTTIGASTINPSKLIATSAAASTVVSPGLSYTGATSTTSAPTTCKPDRPSRIDRSSRVLQPPGSDVPVAAGCQLYIHELRKTIMLHCVARSGNADAPRRGWNVVSKAFSFRVNEDGHAGKGKGKEREGNATTKQCNAKPNSPGANAGSSTSISTLIYTLLVPTLFLIVSMTPETPIRSMSRALMVAKPQRRSLRRSWCRFMTGARMPACREVLRMRPCGC
jgi:hypothetical protein